MHPALLGSLATQRHNELHRMAIRHNRRPRLHFSWSRLATRNGSSLVIVISAHRA